MKSCQLMKSFIDCVARHCCDGIKIVSPFGSSQEVVNWQNRWLTVLCGIARWLRKEEAHVNQVRSYWSTKLLIDCVARGCKQKEKGSFSGSRSEVFNWWNHWLTVLLEVVRVEFQEYVVVSAKFSWLLDLEGTFIFTVVVVFYWSSAVIIPWETNSVSFVRNCCLPWGTQCPCLV